MSTCFTRSALLLFALAACGGVSPGDGDGDGDGDAGSSALSVVSVSPSDGSAGVETLEPLVITFSDVIDVATVNETSVAVLADGIAVAGTLSLEEDTVRFEPDIQWHLAARVEVRLAATIASLTGDLLAATTSSFAVRDGQWSSPALIAEDAATSFFGPASNRAGDIAFPFETAAQDIGVVTFNASTQRFAAPVIVESLSRGFRAPAAAINESGNAIVTFSGLIGETPQVVGWSRFDGTLWSPGETQDLNTGGLRVALTGDGTAVAAVQAIGMQLFSLHLGANAASWTTPVAVDSGFLHGVSAVGDRVQMVIGINLGGFVSRDFDAAAASFGAARTIDTSGAVTVVTHASASEDRATVSWQRDSIELHGAIYNLATESWSKERLGDGTGGSQLCVNSSGKRVGAFQSGGVAIVRVAEPGLVFGAPENVGSPAGVAFAKCAIDDGGRAHAFFGGGTDALVWSRLSADGQWTQTAEVLPNSGLLRGFSQDRVGNVTLIYIEGGQAFARRYE